MKTVLIYSGGLDSTTLMYHLRGQGHTLRCLGVDYGQRHKRELVAAREICKGLAIEYRIADLAGIQPLLSGSALTSDIDVPEGHYTDDSMKATVVPNRNMILLSIAIGWAISLEYEAVGYGAHAGDHTIYPDCRPKFVEAMSRAAELCDWHPVRILRPFVDKTKVDIVRMGDSLGVPFEKTWSCYNGAELHCGQCGTCVERIEAFALAGVADTTIYQNSVTSIQRPCPSGSARSGHRQG